MTSSILGSSQIPTERVEDSLNETHPVTEAHQIVHRSRRVGANRGAKDSNASHVSLLPIESIRKRRAESKLPRHRVRRQTGLILTAFAACLGVILGTTLKNPSYFFEDPSLNHTISTDQVENTPISTRAPKQSEGQEQRNDPWHSGENTLSSDVRNPKGFAGPGDEAPPPLPHLFELAQSHTMMPGETLGGALSRSALNEKDAQNLLKGLTQKIDFKVLRPGDSVELKEIVASTETPMGYLWKNPNDNQDVAEFDKPKGNFLSFDYKVHKKHGAAVHYNATPSAKDGNLNVSRIEAPTKMMVEKVSGVIQSSLYNSLVGAGELSQLANQFADMFGWSIDFYRDPQAGDEFQLIVEKEYSQGDLVGYGKILAAEYINSGRVHSSFRFNSTDGKVSGLFDEKGETSERLFLTTPLALTRITSSYGQRFHPVLKTWKKHNGVDYGASTGTPFWTVASGTVIDARYSASAGNMIRIQHVNGYVTEYFHASKIAPGIQKGVKVKQKQVIGYVGTTGRSTGPHLHFGMLKKGAHVNPSTQKFPGGKPMPSSYKAEFLEQIKPLQEQLKYESATRSVLR